MTQPSLLLPCRISSSVAEEHKYTAHEMWVMAEISGRSHSSYLLAIQSFNDTFEERTRNSRFEWILCSVLNADGRPKKNRSDPVDNNHPARALSDVASSLAPSPGRRPAPEGARSARRGVLRLQSARCSIRPVVPRKVLRPRRKRRRCPSTALAGPQSSRRKSAGGGG